jgi:hypothetical protein
MVIFSFQTATVSFSGESSSLHEFSTSRNREETTVPTPIFIFSLPRSGSTLLQRVFVSSGIASSFGEPHLLLRLLTRAGDPACESRTSWWSFLLEAAESDMRESFPDYDCHWRSGARKMMDQVYGGLAGEKSYFVDKTPRYSLIAKEILETFPDAKFVLLWRNPFASVRSIHKAWEHGRWNVNRWKIDLNFGYQRLFDVMNQFPEKVYSMHYEVLTSQPNRTIQQMWDSLHLPGEAPSEDCLKHSLVAGSLGDPSVNRRSTSFHSSAEDLDSFYSNWYRQRWAKHFFEQNKFQCKSLGHEVPHFNRTWSLGSKISGIRDMTRHWRKSLTVKSKTTLLLR